VTVIPNHLKQKELNVPWITKPEIPIQMQERIVCSISAAVKYQVPANIVLAVAEKEAGKPGQLVRNSNGTHDVGPMQFNTAYLGELAKYGITANNVAISGCYSFDLAAWRLRGHIRHDKGDIWTRAANYHSRTFCYNEVYWVDLISKAVKWADWLDARFVTYDITKPGAPVLTPVVQQLTPEKTVAAIIPEVSQVHRPIKSVFWDTSKYVPRTITFNEEP
jgi:hypothetical protein